MTKRTLEIEVTRHKVSIEFDFYDANGLRLMEPQTVRVFLDGEQFLKGEQLTVFLNHNAQAGNFNISKQQDAGPYGFQPVPQQFQQPEGGLAGGSVAVDQGDGITKALAELLRTVP